MSNQKIPAVIKRLWNKHKKLRAEKLKTAAKHHKAVEIVDRKHDKLVQMRAKLDANLKIQNCKADEQLARIWVDLTNVCAEKKIPIATLIVSDNPQIPRPNEPAR